jgi:endonuclease YncB( thermonuclease family)
MPASNSFRSPRPVRGRESLAGWLLPGLLFLSHAAGAADLSGRVVGVSDGDTLTILDTGGSRHEVWLAHIDAPEKAQRFGARSRQSLAELCAGKVAEVEQRALDRHGRTIGWVMCGGINANGEQVRRGMAWVDVGSAPPTSALYRLEADARLAKRGLWRDRRPVAPWVWRRSHE